MKINIPLKFILILLVVLSFCCKFRIKSRNNEPNKLLFGKKELKDNPNREEMLTDEALKHILTELGYADDKITGCLKDTVVKDKHMILDAFIKSAKTGNVSDADIKNISDKFKCQQIVDINTKLSDKSIAGKLAEKIKIFTKRFR